MHKLPITEAAVNAGGKMLANVVALGAMNALLNLIAAESLEQAVSATVPAKFRAMNAEALKAGQALVTGVALHAGAA